MHPLVSLIGSRDHYLERRDHAMMQCRANLECLINPMVTPAWGYEGRNGPVAFPERVMRPAYDRRDPVVLEANRKWVERARHFHEIAMGRKPAIPNFQYSTPQGSGSGPLYIQEKAHA